MPTSCTLRLPIPLSNSCVLDRRTHLRRSALCFWHIPQSFLARACWRTTTGPTSSVWWYRRVKPRGLPTSVNLSKRQRPRDWCSRLLSAPACPDTKWHQETQTENVLLKTTDGFWTRNYRALGASGPIAALAASFFLNTTIWVAGLPSTHRAIIRDLAIFAVTFCPLRARANLGHNARPRNYGYRMRCRERAAVAQQAIHSNPCRRSERGDKTPQGEGRRKRQRTS